MSNFNYLNHFTRQKRLLAYFIGFLLLSPVAFAEIKGFEDFKGKPQLLENQVGNGKWVVAVIWASDCHVCNVEAHQYVDFHLVHSDKDATVLGISIDGAENKKAAEKFIQKHAIDFPNLIAEANYVGEYYKKYTGQYFRGTPTIMVFDPKGELKAASPGAVPTTLIEEFIKKSSINVVEK